VNWRPCKTRSFAVTTEHQHPLVNVDGFPWFRKANKAPQMCRPSRHTVPCIGPKALHSSFTQTFFSSQVSRYSTTPHSRCTLHRTNSTLLSLSLVLCRVPFPHSGTLKVRGDIQVNGVHHFKTVRRGLEYGHLFMIWTSPGSLFQSTNSVVWNKDMTTGLPSTAISVNPLIPRLLSVCSLFVTHPVFG
jgi:hypothetical protein